MRVCEYNIVVAARVTAVWIIYARRIVVRYV